MRKVTDPPTDRQLEVLSLITKAVRSQGYPPTLRELRDELGVSSIHGISDHLRFLARRGLVSWLPGSPRTLRVTEAGQEALERARRAA